jgi:hypothetical protein
MIPKSQEHQIAPLKVRRRSQEPGPDILRTHILLIGAYELCRLFPCFGVLVRIRSDMIEALMASGCLEARYESLRSCRRLLKPGNYYECTFYLISQGYGA